MSSISSIPAIWILKPYDVAARSGCNIRNPCPVTSRRQWPKKHQSQGVLKTPSLKQAALDSQIVFQMSRKKDGSQFWEGKAAWLSSH